MSLKSYFSVVEKARKPERESPTRTEPHDGTDSSTSDEGEWLLWFSRFHKRRELKTVM